MEQRVTEVAAATGKNVYIGRKGHNDDWFAGCDGIEREGRTAKEALDAVIAGLVNKAESEAHKAQRAAAALERIRALKPHRSNGEQHLAAGSGAGT